MAAQAKFALTAICLSGKNAGMNVAAHKLTAFLKHEGILQSAFAERVNVRSSTITRLLNGERTPSLGLANRIFEQTQGKVTLSDWLARHAEEEELRDQQNETFSSERGGALGRSEFVVAAESSAETHTERDVQPDDGENDARGELKLQAAE
jgi:transcriptional regulator with XRE-family HTH domain